MRNISIIEVPSELGAGTRGSSMGPDAIQIASLDFRSRYFADHIPRKVETLNELLWEPPKCQNAKRIQGIVTMYERISAAVQETIAAGNFPLILAGDHSNAGGTIAGLRAAHPNETLGVIWIDAHADLHTPYTSPSGNVHGMPLAASLGEDNKAKSANKPLPETIEAWEALKHSGGICPKIRYEDVVIVGLRDYEPQEEHLIKYHGMSVFTVEELRQRGVVRTTRSILNKLKHVDRVYVSFDVDSMDPAVSRGTGTPVLGGLSEREATNLLLELAQSPKLCALEITEVNPTLDSENAMAEIVFEILQKVTNQIMEMG